VIVLSVVRTAKVGFLSNPRRTNVMLSRCRERMYVLANRTFLDSNPAARSSLVGKLALQWKERWVGWNEVLGSKLDI
jgi:superfamily I DNA and/or RNA helicase